MYVYAYRNDYPLNSFSPLSAHSWRAMPRSRPQGLEVPPRPHAPTPSHPSESCDTPTRTIIGSAGLPRGECQSVRSPKSTWLYLYLFSLPATCCDFSVFVTCVPCYVGQGSFIAQRGSWRACMQNMDVTQGYVLVGIRIGIGIRTTTASCLVVSALYKFYSRRSRN